VLYLRATPDSFLALLFCMLKGMFTAPILSILALGTLIAAAFSLFIVYFVRNLRNQNERLTDAVVDFGKTVELATSDRTNAATIAGLTDRLEACEQRSKTALAGAFDSETHVRTLEGTLKSHLARYYREGREAKAEAEEEHDEGVMDLLEAAKAMPVNDVGVVQPSNQRQPRGRKRRRRNRGGY